MSTTGSERPGRGSAAGLELRRLSQLTASTDGSNALRLPQWPVADPVRTGGAGSASPLTLVPGPAPAGVDSGSGAPSHPLAPSTGAAVPPTPAPHRSARPPQGNDPLLREQARAFAQALVEILAGDRTLTQLVRWTTAEVYEQLHHRVHTLASCPRPTSPATTAGPYGGPVRRRRARPRVASLHISMPSDGVAEVSARVDHGVRSTAVALRFEQRSGGRVVPSEGMLLRVTDHRWMCTAVTWV